MHDNLAMAYALKKRARMARGGMAQGAHEERCSVHDMAGCEMCMADGGEVGEVGPGQAFAEGFSSGYNGTPMPQHKKRLPGEMESTDPSDAEHMAEGGMVDPAEDMVGRIMRSRQGGAPIADEESSDYDRLDEIPEDHEADETAKNSGDEIGDDMEDEREHDVVSRIMRSRSKKDRMPRPA